MKSYGKVMVLLDYKDNKMEGFTFGEVVAGVTVIVGNVIGLKWVRSDLKKQDEIVKSNREDITRLFDRMDKTMTRQDIKELVTECVGALKKDNEKALKQMEKISGTVTSIKEDFIRIDERYKAHIEHDNDRRSSD